MMDVKGLIVATSFTPPDARGQISLGLRHRIDYIELSARLRVPYVDYSWVVKRAGLLRSVEKRLRLDLQQAAVVAATIHKARPDVVFSMSERVGIPLSLLAPTGVRHVVQLHHMLSPAKVRIVKMLRVPDHWHVATVYTLAESAALRSMLPSQTCAICHVPYSVDANFWSPGDLSSACTDEAFVLSVGLSCRDYPTLVRACRRLPNINCRVYAGSSWISEGGIARGEALPSSLHLDGYVTPSDLRAEYRKCRFVVTPIRPTTQWSAGVTSMLEAQAVGKAVIATRTPGSSEYVLDGETGILVESGNPAAMSDAIEYLWHNPAIAERMGRAARDWVQRNFALEMWLDRVANLLYETKVPANTP